ncbi:hypothetical protein T484DRAFT_1963201 [Baffinella frigidus]|nr:hypothetical protein T484DRAFT_1963201 [Cryptophyta sp. CCMP2293]
MQQQVDDKEFGDGGQEEEEENQEPQEVAEPATEEETLVLSKLEEMALEELMRMLEHKSAIVRSGAMAVVAGLSVTTQGRMAIIAQEPDIIPILVEKIGGQSIAVEAAASMALVNLAEDEAAAKRVVKAGAGQKAMERILTCGADQGSVRETAAKLLVNVSRIAEGRRALAGYVADGSAEIQRKLLTLLVTEYENSRRIGGDHLASLAFFFENMAQEVTGALVLCNEEDFLLGRIVKDLAGNNGDRKLGAAGTMKNCCFHQELHSAMASHRDLAALLCLNLVGTSDEFDDEDREGMFAGLATKCRMGGKVTESAELRKTIYEALRMLTRSRIGREYLRQEKIYPVLREVHKFEESFEVPDEDLIELLELVVEAVMLIDEPEVD